MATGSICVVGESPSALSQTVDKLKEVLDEYCDYGGRKTRIDYEKVPRHSFADYIRKDRCLLGVIFVIVRSPGQRCSIYDEDDTAHSLYNEIEQAQTVLNGRERIFIIVRRSRRRGGEVSENSLHDKEIEDLWTIGSQPKLKRFDKQLFTVPSHSQRELNESQIGALRRAFDQPERKPAPTLDSDSSTKSKGTSWSFWPWSKNSEANKTNSAPPTWSQRSEGTCTKRPGQETEVRPLLKGDAERRASVAAENLAQEDEEQDQIKLKKSDEPLEITVVSDADLTTIKVNFSVAGRIVFVNGHSVGDMTKQEATDVTRSAPDDITLVVERKRMEGATTLKADVSVSVRRKATAAIQLLVRDDDEDFPSLEDETSAS